MRTPLRCRALAVVVRSVAILAVAVGLLAAPYIAAAQRVSGLVASSVDGTVWLDDGTAFGVDDSTRVVVSSPGSVENLQSGQYVAITATRLPDGTLLASMVAVFPQSQSGAFAGQFLQASGDLMTNASIDEAIVDEMVGGLLMVSFQGQMEHVIIPPTAQINVRSDGTLNDIQPGVSIAANVVDGFASSVSLGT